MGNPNLLPYETIVRAASRKPWTRFYGITASVSGLPPLKHIDRDPEDSIKSRLVAALFKFRFDEQTYPKTE